MATTTTYTFTNFNRVPKPWAGGPILLPDKVSVQVGYASAANLAPKPFSALDAANSAVGIYSVQNVAAAAASQGADAPADAAPAPAAEQDSEAAPAPAPAAAPAPAPAPKITAPPKMASIPKGPRKPTLGAAGSAKVQQPIFSGKIPVCAVTGKEIRGPFILALGKTFSPDAFVCANTGVSLQDVGFVEEGGQLFCEAEYEKHFAPRCAKCGQAIKNDCVNAMGKTFHPECFVCFHYKTPIGSEGFHIEDGEVYSKKAWEELFTTKCYGCGFPIEPSDRWVEALGQNWHAECFNCAVCGVNLEGQSFYAKGGRPYCKKHASAGFR